MIQATFLRSVLAETINRILIIYELLAHQEHEVDLLYLINII